MADAPPKELKQLKPDRQLCTIRYSPCGKWLVAGGQEGEIRRWDASTDALPDRAAIAGHHGWVQALAFHPDQKRLFAGDSWGRLCAWPYADAEPKPLWQVEAAHDGWIRAAAVSPDGGRLATVGRDGAVRLWSPDSGQPLPPLRDAGPDTFCAAFHPSGKFLFTGDLFGSVKSWELATGKAVRTYDAGVLYFLSRLQDVGGVRCLACDKEGKTLYCGGTRPSVGANVQGVPTLLAFDVESGKLKKTLSFGTQADGFVYDLAVHPRGYLLLVTSGNPGNGRLHLIRPEEDKPFNTQTKMANCHSLALHPSGRRLAVSATNANSAGNGRPKGDVYPGNFSPITVWELT